MIVAIPEYRFDIERLMSKELLINFHFSPPVMKSLTFSQVEFYGCQKFSGHLGKQLGRGGGSEYPPVWELSTFMHANILHKNIHTYSVFYRRHSVGDILDKS